MTPADFSQLRRRGTALLVAGWIVGAVLALVLPSGAPLWIALVGMLPTMYVFLGVEIHETSPRYRTMVALLALFGGVVLGAGIGVVVGGHPIWTRLAYLPLGFGALFLVFGGLGASFVPAEPSDVNLLPRLDNPLTAGAAKAGQLVDRADHGASAALDRLLRPVDRLFFGTNSGGGSSQSQPPLMATPTGPQPKQGCIMGFIEETMLTVYELGTYAVVGVGLFGGFTLITFGVLEVLGDGVSLGAVIAVLISGLMVFVGSTPFRQ